MISIRRTEFIRYDYSSARSIDRVELDIDSASELPTVDAFDGMRLYQGSIAWDVSTGDFYGLNSEGTWYKQDGTGAYDPEAEVSLSAAPNLNIGNINRPAVQPIQLAQPNFIDSEDDTDDFENVEESTEEEPEVIEDEPEAEREVIKDAEPLRDAESR